MSFSIPCYVYDDWFSMSTKLNKVISRFLAKHYLRTVLECSGESPVFEFEMITPINIGGHHAACGGPGGGKVWKRENPSLPVVWKIY